MELVPKKVFFTKGVGIHKDELRSFELALRDAGIEKMNLVYVSSIFPPGCKIIPKSQGLDRLQTGAITFTPDVKRYRGLGRFLVGRIFYADAANTVILFISPYESCSGRNR